MSIESESQRIDEIASQSAAGREQFGDWNKTYAGAVEREGYALIAVASDTFLGFKGPIMAPLPVADEDWTYPYPSVIAPKDWMPPEQL